MDYQNFLLFLLSLSSSILMIWNETSHVVRHSRFANNTPHFFTGSRFYYGLLHPFHTVSYLSDSYIGIFPIESFFILNCKPCVLHMVLLNIVFIIVMCVGGVCVEYELERERERQGVEKNCIDRLIHRYVMYLIGFMLEVV